MYKRIIAMILSITLILSQAVPTLAVEGEAVQEGTSVDLSDSDVKVDSVDGPGLIQDTTTVTVGEGKDTSEAEVSIPEAVQKSEQSINESTDKFQEEIVPTESEKESTKSSEEEKQELTNEELLAKAKAGANLTAEEKERLNAFMLAENPPSPTDKKRMIVSSAAAMSEGISNSISSTNPKTDYLEIVTQGYNFSMGQNSDSSKRLLYGWPGGSKWMYQIDGNVYSSTGAYVYNPATGRSVGTTTTGDISITTELYITKSTSSGKDDVAAIVLTAKNNSSSVSHNVGAKIGMDVYVAGNDSAPFYTATKGRFNTQTVLKGNDIPQYWQALNNITNPTFIGQGTFYRTLSERPDSVYFTHYSTACSSYSPRVSPGAPIGDSGVAARWDQKPLAAGESRTYTIWLGMGQMEVNRGDDVTLATTADVIGDIDNTGKAYIPFTVTNVIKNTSASVLNDIKVSITLPDGMNIVDGSDVVKTISSLAPGAEATVAWQIQTEPIETGGTRNYTIEVKQGSDLLTDVTKSIEFPPLDLVAPVINDIISTIGYSSSSVTIGLPSATDGNSVTEYIISCNGQEQIVNANEKSAIITGLSVGEKVRVQVSARDAAGNRSEPVSADIMAKNPVITSPVDGEIFTVGGKETVSLEGKATVGGDTTYHVYWRKQGTDGWNELDSSVSRIQNKGFYTDTITASLDLSNLEPGKYDVRYVATDSDDMSVERIVVYNVNNIIPSTIVGLSAQGDIHSINLSWALAAEYDVDTYRIYRRIAGSSDWALLYELTGGRNNTSYIDKTAEKGIVYEYSVTAVSPYGLEGEYCNAVSSELIPDTEKPVINSLSPVRNTVLNGIVTVTASAVDNDSVSKIELYYKRTADEEGILLGSADGSIVSAKLDTTVLDDGKIMFYAIATDISGNQSNGSPVNTCSVDNTGPAKVTDLNYTCTATVITLSWKYVQDNDFDHFVVEEKQSDGSFRTVSKVNKTLGVNITKIEPGSTHTYRVYAVDRIGNKGEMSEEVTVVAKSDTSAPVVTEISPSAGYKNADFTVSFTMKDDHVVAGAQVQMSRDRINWTTLDTKSYSDGASAKTLKYTVKVSDYPEDGSIYLRAIPVDKAGNQGDSNNATAPFVEYVLDRTPPAIPQNVSAKAEGTGIYLRWNNDSAGETVSYRVLRSSSKNGIYKAIASNVKAISYYDRTAAAETTYWYQIQSEDKVGNLSAGSVPVSASWTNSEDLKKPQILSVGPEEGKKLGGTNTNISVLAQDDRLLSRVVITYARVGLFGITTDEQTLTINGNNKYYINSSAKPNLGNYSTGDKMKVTVAAYDANENCSDVVERTYSVDKTAPGVDNLKATIKGAKVSITWNSGANSDDLNGYYIYCSKGGSWAKIGSCAFREDGKYSYIDTLQDSGTYSYKVVAVDLTGNQAEYVSNNVSYTKPAVPKLIADFTTDQQQQQGVQYLFDASPSRTDSTIVSYVFDFGDGTTGNGMKPIHIYKELGTYTVTLTVTDENGLTASVSKKVEVKDRASLGNMEVTVVDDSGTPVSGAPVYFNMGSDEQVVKTTDARGVVSFTCTAGTYAVGSYMSDYLPVTKQVIVSGNTTNSVQLIMVNQPIVSGEFEVNRMTLEEIIASGIDVTDPANQHCVSVTVQIAYGEQMVGFDFVRNDYGQVVFGENTTIIGDRQFTAMILPESEAWKGSDTPGGSEGEPGQPGTPVRDIVAILETPVNAAFLKEFFNVKLHILNQAAEDFSLRDNSIQLNIPDGMTLMPESQNGANEVLSILKGQQEWSLSWILRGDAAGDYTVTADYSGILSGFEAAVTAQFKSPSIRVYGSQAMHLVINLNRSIRYQACYLDLGIKNMTETDMNLPSVGIKDAVVRAIERVDGKDDIDSKESEVISTWVENRSGYKEYMTEDPASLSSGETLYHRFAIYGVTSDDTVQYLNNIVLKELENIGIEQIEVYVNNFDLYPDSESSADKIMEIAGGIGKNELQYLMNSYNFKYYQTGYDDKNSPFFNLAAFGKDMLDVALTVDFDCVTNNTNRAFFRSIVAEMMFDEVLNDYVTTKIDDTYAKVTKDILINLSAALKLMDGVSADKVDSVFGQIMQDDNTISAMSKLLEKEGVSTSFKERIARVICAELGEFNQEYILNILKKPEYADIVNTDLIAELGDVGEVLELGADVAVGWAHAIEAANTMLMLKYAQEESNYFFDTLIRQLELSSADKNSWICSEARIMQQELQEKSAAEKAALRTFINEAVQTGGELAVDKIIGEATSSFLQNHYGISANMISSLSGAYNFLKVVYKMADYMLNISDYYERKDQIIAMMIMNSVFVGEYNMEDATNFEKVHALKYIIKTHLVGERVFVDYVNAVDRRKELFEKGNGVSANQYLTNINKLILSARDKLYNTVTTQNGAPAAPKALTFDYLNGHTVQKFDNTYEYSINGGVSWITCGNTSGDEDYIYITGKTIEQSLYVRLRETQDNRAGSSAILVLPAASKHRYATAAGALNNTCVVWGVTPKTTYEVLRASTDDPENLDWSNAEKVIADSDGIMSFRMSGGDYLFYRIPATASAFASVAYSIVLSRDLVGVSAQAEGDGKVLCDGEVFNYRALANGDTLTLVASYDKNTTEFKGWYVDGELYSTKITLDMKVTSSISLTAKFEKLPQYDFKVTAGDGGRVEGGGSFYKGASATVHAYADRGYTFSCWKDTDGNVVSVNSNYTVMMLEDISLTAIFEKLPTANIHISMSVQEIEGMEEPSITVTVGDDVRGEVTPSKDFEIEDIQQNTPVTVAAADSKDATFDSWQTETGTVVSTDRTFTFNAEEYTHYIAVYKVQGQTVTFVSFCGDIQSSKQYTASTDVSAITLVDGITRVGYNFVGWKIGNEVYNTTTEEGKNILKEAILNEIKESKDVILNAVYEQQTKRYTITVINGTGGGTYASNTAVTVTANQPQKGMNFAGWYEGDTLLSTNRSYSFYVLTNRTLTARYTQEQVKEVGTTRIEEVSCNKDSKKITFVSMSSVPNSCKIEKAGIIATSNSAIGNDKNRFNVANADFVRYGTTSAKNYRYTWTKSNVTEGQAWYVRAYLVYTDANGNTYTVYGDIVATDLNGIIN